MGKPKKSDAGKTNASLSLAVSTIARNHLVKKSKGT